MQSNYKISFKKGDKYIELFEDVIEVCKVKYTKIEYVEAIAFDLENEETFNKVMQKIKDYIDKNN